LIIYEPILKRKKNCGYIF